MIFDPEIARRFADCGITFLDEPTDVIPMVMLHLGRDPNSLDPEDMRDAEAVLKGVRPYIRYFSSAKMLIDLPNEEVCIAMSWSGDYAQAMWRAREVGRPVDSPTRRRGKGPWPGSTCGSSRPTRPIRTTRISFSTTCSGPRSSPRSVMETRYATPNRRRDPAPASRGTRRPRRLPARRSP